MWQKSLKYILNIYSPAEKRREGHEIGIMIRFLQYLFINNRSNWRDFWSNKKIRTLILLHLIKSKEKNITQIANLFWVSGWRSFTAVVSDDGDLLDAMVFNCWFELNCCIDEAKPKSLFSSGCSIRTLRSRPEDNGERISFSEFAADCTGDWIVIELGLQSSFTFNCGSTSFTEALIFKKWDVKKSASLIYISQVKPFLCDWLSNAHVSSWLWL